jgi:hypothetical protein
MYCRRLIALMIICAYLFIPLESYAGLEPLAPSLPDGASLLQIVSPKKPASHCPCSDRHAPDGCNTACSCCSCCSFFAPPASGIVFIPTTTALIMPEPAQRFPEVYLPIFVPPQNRS